MVPGVDQSTMTDGRVQAVRRELAPRQSRLAALHGYDLNGLALRTVANGKVRVSCEFKWDPKAPSGDTLDV